MLLSSNKLHCSVMSITDSPFTSYIKSKAFTNAVTEVNVDGRIASYVTSFRERCVANFEGSWRKQFFVLLKTTLTG